MGDDGLLGGGIFDDVDVSVLVNHPDMILWQSTDVQALLELNATGLIVCAKSTVTADSQDGLVDTLLPPSKRQGVLGGPGLPDPSVLADLVAQGDVSKILRSRLDESRLSCRSAKAAYWCVER